VAAATIVLDASALLAIFKTEPGWQRAALMLPNAALCSVNAAEIFSKLSEWAVPKADHARFEALLEAMIVPFDADLALRAGALRSVTKAAGLSLGDRCCLALAMRLGVPVMTADKAWAKLNLKVEIEIIR
jgi:ribonuclease VapC